MAKLNFKAVAGAALDNFESVVVQWLPNGKYEGAEYCCLNPRRSDSSTGSFKVNRNSGVWSDFATDDKGADLISLVAYLDNCSQGDAYKSLSSFLGLRELSVSPNLAPTQKSAAKKPSITWKAILPVPDEAVAGCPSSHPQNGEPSSRWVYLDSAGKLLMKVFRFDFSKNGEKKKDYRPLTYCLSSQGEYSWRWMAPKDSRPLYGLDDLAGRAHSPVLLLEGEKAADAAKHLFPTYVCMAWPNGSKAIAKANFSPLVDREVLFFPDNDEAGHLCTNILEGTLKSVGAKSFEVVDISVLEVSPIVDEAGTACFGEAVDWPEKADAADAVELGWSAAHIDKLFEAGLLILGGNSKAVAELTKEDLEASTEIPFGFRLVDSALETWVKTDDKGKDIYRPICKPLKVLARTTNASNDGRNWGKLVSFKDPSGAEKEWNIPTKLFATEGGAEIKRELLDRGLEIGAHREDDRKVIQYLKAIEPSITVGLVQKLGWHNEAFVLPDRVLGSSSRPLFFDGEKSGRCNIIAKGTLSDWQNNIAKYCVGNELAVLGVCTALAGPLVSVLGLSENLGLHYHGDSSLGKSTLLNLACSVYGNPEQYRKTWRTTDNALENTAASHSDMFLALDELNQVDSKIVDNVVYMLGNGSGKNRAGDYATAPVSQWTLSFISNGEKTLEQYMGEAGKKVTGGMEMRFLSIYASPHTNEKQRRQYGIFKTVHGYAGGAALSNHLSQEMKKYHGTAFIAFVEKLVGQNKKDLAPWLLSKLKQFKQDHLGPENGGQVSRAADKFGLIGWAGELATKWGVTGWEKGEALRAADHEFKVWLERRGGTGNLEEMQMLNHVRNAISLKGESHYRRWDHSEDGKNSVIDRHVPSKLETWGFYKEEITKNYEDGNSSDLIYYTTAEAFKNQLCKGYDYKAVARLLREKGILMLRKNERERNRLCSRDKLPGYGDQQQQVFKFRASALFAEQTDGDGRASEADAANF